MHDWMVDFKALVEHSYVTNSNQSVVLLAHSMGSPLSLYFLNLMSQAWKDKHILVISMPQKFKYDQNIFLQYNLYNLAIHRLLSHLAVSGVGL